MDGSLKLSLLSLFAGQAILVMMIWLFGARIRQVRQSPQFVAGPNHLPRVSCVLGNPLAVR